MSPSNGRKPMKAPKPEAVKRLVKFIIERHQIYLRRFVEKLPKPWTTDKILRQYRFCNVYRELDTVTLWIAKNWRQPNERDPDLWFAFAVARLVNWPETLSAIGYPVPWNATRFMNVMNARAARDQQLYSGAYMISTHGVKMNKAKYLAAEALTPMWKNREEIRPRKGELLFDLHQRLINCRDLGTFMSGQIIADLKYAAPYRKAADWQSFAASGPGSRRGLNRICGVDINDPWNEDYWKSELLMLLGSVNPRLPKIMEPLHAQDLQNCLCEFDKYERVRLNQGRPKSTYPGV